MVKMFSASLLALLLILVSMPVGAIGNDNILFIVPSNSIPDRKLDSVNAFLPVNKLGLYTISKSYSAEQDKIKKIVFSHELIKKLSPDEELAFKDFLREQFEKGKEIWVIGTNIPDNFLQLWLGIERKLKTYRVSERDFHLASGLWKDKDLPTGSNMNSPQLLSLEEVLREIRDIKR